MKSRVKTWLTRGIWSQQLEHKQVPQWWDRTSCTEGYIVSVPCWHATPVANAPWKPIIIGEGQVRYRGHESGGKSDWLGSHCWSRIRMSFNIRERETSYCRIRSPYRPNNFLNDDFKRSTRFPCLSSLLESRLALRIKHSYEEQARAYRIS